MPASPSLLHLKKEKSITTMTATVSVSQQSAHVNQHDADKDLYFD